MITAPNQGGHLEPGDLSDRLSEVDGRWTTLAAETEGLIPRLDEAGILVTTLATFDDEGEARAFLRGLWSLLHR